MKDKMKMFNIILITVIEDKNWKNGGEAISKETKAMSFQG